MSVVIVAHQSWGDLRMTLPALMDELGATDEVIVVDSGSSDGLALELARAFPTVPVVPRPRETSASPPEPISVSQSPRST